MGAPDDWGVGKSTLERAEIWRYGNFELHFGADGRCWLIFSDYVQHGLDAGRGRSLDLWVFADHPRLPVALARLRDDGLRVDEADERDMRCLRIGATRLFFDSDQLAVFSVKA